MPALRSSVPKAKQRVRIWLRRAARRRRVRTHARDYPRNGRGSPRTATPGAWTRLPLEAILQVRCQTPAAGGAPSTRVGLLSGQPPAGAVPPHASLYASTAPTHSRARACGRAAPGLRQGWVTAPRLALLSLTPGLLFRSLRTPARPFGLAGTAARAMQPTMSMRASGRPLRPTAAAPAALPVFAGMRRPAAVDLVGAGRANSLRSSAALNCRRGSSGPRRLATTAMFEVRPDALPLQPVRRSCSVAAEAAHARRRSEGRRAAAARPP